MTKLFPRYIQQEITEALADTPVVCLIGPRQSGKTTLARQLAPKRHYISFDDETQLVLAKADPVAYVQGLPDPVILDEIQRVPELLLAIKTVVDEKRFQQQNCAGQFLLTGSANLLLLPKVSESLAGRMQVIILSPLSELEKKSSAATFSVSNNLLIELLQGKIKTRVMPDRVNADVLAAAVCSGGYPEPNRLPEKQAVRWYRQYLQAIAKRDIRDIATIRDADELLRLMELLSLRTANLLNLSAIANELGLSRITIEKYIHVLEQLFLIRRLQAWHGNQAKRLIKTPKIHVVDSGLAAALNHLSPAHWNALSDDFGHLLESFVVQQFICQAGWCASDLRFYYYRDKDQIEVDLVIEQGRKVWGVEIKRSGTVQNSDGKGLARLADQAGKNFQGGLLLYSGNATFPLQKAPKSFAVPLSRLWE